MQGEGFLIELISSLGVSSFEGKVAESDAGNGRELAIGLGGDRAIIVGLRLCGIPGDVVDIGKRKKALRVAGMGRKIGHETLQGRDGIFRFSLIDLDLGLAEEGVSGRDGSGKLDQDAIKRCDVAFIRSGGVGFGGGEVLLRFDLCNDEISANGDSNKSDGGEDLGPVTVDRVHHIGGLAGGEGVEVMR